MLGGTPGIDGMIEEALPDCLAELTTQLFEDGLFPMAPNHVLVNEYHPGQGIMPHKARRRRGTLVLCAAKMAYDLPGWSSVLPPSCYCITVKCHRDAF